MKNPILAYAFAPADELYLIEAEVVQIWDDEPTEGVSGSLHEITFLRVVNDNTGEEIYPHECSFDRDLRYRLQDGVTSAWESKVAQGHAVAWWADFEARNAEFALQEENPMSLYPVKIIIQQIVSTAGGNYGSWIYDVQPDDQNENCLSPEGQDYRTPELALQAALSHIEWERLTRIEND